MSRLDEIKARTEQVQHWTSTTSIEQAMARLASSAADVPWLISEVERLTDLCDEFRKREESQDRIRQRLTADVERLRGWIDRSERQEARARRAEAEVARLTAERDALAQIKRHIDEVRDGTGWTVQIYGVLLQRCDEYGKTVDTRRAERAEAERDALAAQVARVEALAGQWERLADTAINPDSREWLQACAATLRECLSGWQKMHAALAAPTETDDLERCDCGRVVPCRHCDPTGQEDSPDAGHRCEPYYSRAECGQCGWQEQWCVTCSRKMCGCATDTMGADQ